MFAFFAAGVAVGGADGIVRAATDPVALGIVAGLVLGKPIGILLAVRTLTLVTKIRLHPALRWVDMLGVALLAGIGFTVSLLIAELSFPAGSTEGDDAKIAIMIASVLAALIASAILVARNRRYRQIEAAETIDEDADGTPDIYQDAPRTQKRTAE